MAQDGTALAGIGQRMVAVTRGGAQGVASRALTSREKAAVIVRFLLSEGTPIPLTALPDHMQTALAEQMGQMRRIDRTTLGAVLEEFIEEMEQLGLSFPGGLDGALSVIGNHISPNAASRLRRMAGGQSRSDPWERLVLMESEDLLPVLQEEAIEVAAVLLSKLPVPKAAELLGKLPGDKARRIAYAVSLTGNVDPDTVHRIGKSLAIQLDQKPPKAFDVGPVERVGAILNVTTAGTRDDVLKGLEEEDAGFAEQVRKAIFTFVHIPTRLHARDVPKLIRAVDQPVLVTAMTAAQAVPEQAATVEFLLSNMSQRMAQGLREDIAQRGKVKDKEADEAMSTIVQAIRTLEAGGDLVLITEDD